MEKGRILNGERTFPMPWIPENEKKPWGWTERGILKRNGVFLTGWSLTRNEKADLKCWLCRNCKTGIFQGV